MRWYKIEIEGGPTFDASGDPNALNAEMDIPVAAQHVRAGSAYVRVWGIPLQMIQNAKQYNNKEIRVYGGMQQGLPLANPGQRGLLVYGTVFPCVGNWVGTDMTLDFFIGPPKTGAPNPGQAANLIHDWPANTPMKDSIKKTLQKAYPKLKPVITISDQLKLPHDDRGFYQSLTQFSSYINRISYGILGNKKDYPGVSMTINKDKIIVHDGEQPAGGPQINFQDLIGQPIWTGIKTIQFKTVMRGDIEINQTVTLPNSMATLTANSGTNVGGNASNIISGKFRITSVRHTGNFRQPDWPSWASTFDAIEAS